MAEDAILLSHATGREEELAAAFQHLIGIPSGCAGSLFQILHLGPG
jgi:hypothetical protein